MDCNDVKTIGKYGTLLVGVSGIGYSIGSYLASEGELESSERIKKMIAEIGETSLLLFITKQMINLIEVGTCGIEPVTS